MEQRSWERFKAPLEAVWSRRSSDWQADEHATGKLLALRLAAALPVGAAPAEPVGVTERSTGTGTQPWVRICARMWSELLIAVLSGLLGAAAGAYFQRRSDKKTAGEQLLFKVYMLLLELNGLARNYPLDSREGYPQRQWRKA